MSISRLLVIIAILFMATGCTCRTKKVGEGNVPVAGPGDILADVNYAFDSYALDNAAKSVLQKNAEWLKDNAQRKVQIEGHCDERGTNEYNMALGSNRAKSAMNYLRSLGIEANRMSTVSYGEELPLDPRHNEEAWAKNRRAHFNLQN